MFQFEDYTLDLARHLLRAGDREIRDCVRKASRFCAISWKMRIAL